MQAWHLFWRTSAKDCFALHTPFTVSCPFCFIFSTFFSSLPLLLRSSRSEVFYKKAVLRNFAKFTGKHLCQTLFNRLLIKLLKKKLWHRFFPVNFAKFLRTPFVTEHLWWLLLTTVNMSDVCFWLKFKRLQKS